MHNRRGEKKRWFSLKNRFHAFLQRASPKMALFCWHFLIFATGATGIFLLFGNECFECNKVVWNFINGYLNRNLIQLNVWQAFDDTLFRVKFTGQGRAPEPTANSSSSFVQGMPVTVILVQSTPPAGPSHHPVMVKQPPLVTVITSHG